MADASREHRTLLSAVTKNNPLKRCFGVSRRSRLVNITYQNISMTQPEGHSIKTLTARSSLSKQLISLSTTCPRIHFQSVDQECESPV